MAIVGIKLFGAKNLLLFSKLTSNTWTRYYGSALFISGKRASETFAILSPVLDFDDRFADLPKLKKDLELRGLEVDIDGMKKAWDCYKIVESNRSTLEKKRSDISNQMKALARIRVPTPEDEAKVTRLKTAGKVIRDDLKVVKEALWELEDSVIVQALKLPNVLHPNTPAVHPTLLYSFGDPPSVKKFDKSQSHVELGQSLGLLEYSSPINYYLFNEAAFFELAALRLADEIFASKEMLRISGLDFTRSIIVEAGGLDHEDPDASFILEDNEDVEKHSPNRMHLVGGASLPSFLAMHTKQLINPNSFPVRYFASGRQYIPFPVGAREAGLLTVCQSSAAQVFVAVKDYREPEYLEEFEKILASVKHLYENLCRHYRIVLRPARELGAWESLRASVELWSPFLSEYVETGHVSLCGEYLSKRLLIGCQTPSGRSFPSVISGTVLSVPKVLGCLLEESEGEFVLPAKLREHMPL